MPFEKGREKTGGKTVGTKNTKTVEWEALGDAIATKHAARFNNIMENANDEQFLRYYTLIVEHFKPKLSRTENKSAVKEEITVRYVRGNS